MSGKTKKFVFQKISRQAGFTMIELIVVIVVIAMLSTIAVAVFRNHLQRGRDSFRKSTVDTIATLVRLDRLKKEEENFDLNKAQVLTILKNNSVGSVDSAADKHYFYGYSAQKKDFFVVVCGESDEFFVKGTPNGMIAVHTQNPVDICDGSAVPIKERASALDPNADSKNLDDYIVYRLS